MDLKRFIVIFWTAFFAALTSLSTAHAQLEIDITKGNIDPTPIAIPSFLGTDAQTRNLGAQISEVIRADLERSGLFKSLDPASFLETQTNAISIAALFSLMKRGLRPTVKNASPLWIKTATRRNFCSRVQTS